MPGPDLTAFREAQAALRSEMGTDVDFLVPVPPDWPAGTRLDPETGQPYDPTIDPLPGTGGTTPVTKRVGLIYRTVTDDPTEDDRSGVRRAKSIALAIEVADYPDIEDATTVAVGDINYRVNEIMRDPGLDDRYLAYCDTR